MSVVVYKRQSNIDIIPEDDYYTEAARKERAFSLFDLPVRDLASRSHLAPLRFVVLITGRVKYKHHIDIVTHFSLFYQLFHHYLQYC